MGVAGKFGSSQLEQKENNIEHQFSNCRKASWVILNLLAEHFYVGTWHRIIYFFTENSWNKFETTWDHKERTKITHLRC